MVGVFSNTVLENAGKDFYQTFTGIGLWIIFDDSIAPVRVSSFQERIVKFLSTCYSHCNYRIGDGQSSEWDSNSLTEPWDEDLE